MKRHYFDHDYSARNDQKILQLRFKHGAEGYGIYWMLLETMAEDSTGYIQQSELGGLSLGYSLPITTLQGVLDNLVEIGLFKQCEHGNYYSDRMLKHREEMQKYTEYGKKGAKKRWGDRGANAGANASRVNKRKRKEIKQTDGDELMDAIGIPEDGSLPF